MGWGPPVFEGDTPEAAKVKQALFQKMTDIGATREQALDMLARFSPAQIGRQVDWLPLRNAKNPARFLLAAIEGNYDPPVIWKRQTEGVSSAQALKPLPDLPDLMSDLPELAGDVFREDGMGAGDGDHTPLHAPENSKEPPDEPALPSSTLYSAG